MIITVPPGQAPHSGGFSERDKLLVELLRPHLHAVYQDSQRRRASAPMLTAHQRGNCPVW